MRDQLASLGPFFAVESHDGPRPAPWRLLAELVTDPAALGARMAQVRAALETPGRPLEARVVASVTQLGLTARLVAPLLGLAVLGAVDAAVQLDELHWQPTLGGPFPLSVPHRLLLAGPGPAGRAPLADVLDGPVRALVDATAAQVPVAPQVLWGNVASTVHAAGHQLGQGRPDLAGRVAAITAATLGHPLLRTAHDPSPAGFRRRSCCLIYRLGGPARPRSVCGDCALAA